MNRKTPIPQLSVFFLLVLWVIPLSGCSALLGFGSALAITHVEDTLQLAWDAEQGGIAGTPSATASFNVYYRRLGTLTWIFLQATGNSIPAATISRIGYGKYEFAVETVSNDGKISAKHTSMDYSAWPAGGWYLKWD